jgi:hypothetical protein
MTSGRFPCIIDEDRFEVSHHYFLLLIQDEEQVAKEAGDARQDTTTAPAWSSPSDPPAGAGDSLGLAFTSHDREVCTRAGNLTDEGPGHESS